MKKTKVPKQTDGFKMEVFDDEVLLYHQQKTKGVYLNNTAAIIWMLCDGKRSTSEVESMLKEAYSEDIDSISDDVHSTIKHLKKIGVIELL